MDSFSPSLRQLIVASTPQLAAMSVGGLTGYPVVLLNQLRINETSIPLDIDSASWIASIHGFIGVLSVFVPTLMQWKGRKFAFILSSCIVIAGWAFAYFAKNVAILLIGESLHGIGGNSLIIVSLVTISEMVEPRFRSISLTLFTVIEAMGFVIVTILGFFLDWKTICIVMSVPVVISLILVCAWPESPPWLACKGKFSECEESFIKLRGTGKESIKELDELIKAQKRERTKLNVAPKDKKNIFRRFLERIRRRDFYVPNFQAMVILFTYYWSGPLVVATYAIDIINTTREGSDFSLFLYIDVCIVTGCILAVVLVQHFKNKPIVLASFSGSIIFLLLSASVIYFKDIFPRQTLLLCIIGYVIVSVAGNAHPFAVSTEVIPVKHRGVGGALYIFFTCLFHSLSIKIAPYLFELVAVSGTFLLFALITILGTLYIWKFVPETKGRTLQEIEDFYNNKGKFIVENRDVEILKDDDGV